MWNWLKRLFPENIFARKIDPSAERRLRLAQARAEESIIRAHVDNALMFVDTLAEDLTFDRAIDSYIRQMAIPEPLASTVATRTLVVLGQDLVPIAVARARTAWRLPTSRGRRSASTTPRTRGEAPGEPDRTAAPSTRGASEVRRGRGRGRS
jgi:hypothetical protein